MSQDEEPAPKQSSTEKQSLQESDMQTVWTDPWGLDPRTGAPPTGRSLPLGSPALIQQQRKTLEQRGYTPEQIERGLQPLVAAYGDDTSDDW